MSDNKSTTKQSKRGNAKDSRCAPAISYDGMSCMSLDMLIALANAYNKKYDDKIKMQDNLDVLNPTKYKEYFVRKFEERLDKVCDDQKCWVKQDFVKELNEEMQYELKKNTWRPDAPQGKFTWLNTFNINDVLGQYEEKYKDFKFLGAVPSDFEEINYMVEGMNFGFADMDMETMYNNGFKKLGVVFNLDKHNQGGSHWVAGYVDMDKGLVYYFDSYGIRPKESIRKFLRRCYRECKKMSGGKISVKTVKKVDDVIENNIRHQFKNSECGVYSINFITRLLDGDSFEQIVADKTNDDDMNQNRQVYFSGGGKKMKK